jgi:hypothetical protein
MKSKEKQAKKASSNAKIKATKKSGGLDEIDSLFAQKKQSDKELQQQITHEKEQAKIERKRRKQARLEEEADEMTLRGSSSVAAAAGPEKKGTLTSAPEALHAKAVKLGKLSYTRSDLEELNDKSKSERKDKWASDGLGGIFNGEGFTGRKDDGHRVFKAHLMNKEGFGQSPDCPFDCDCCFI